MNQGYSPSNFQGQGRNTNNQQSGSSPNNQGGNRKPTVLRPVNIFMLQTAQSMGDGVITIQGREVSQVVLVGQVVDYVDTQMGGANMNNSYGYKICDSTGVLTIKQWFEPGAQPAKAPINSYVRVVGPVKNFRGEMQVSGQISAVTTANEVQYHHLDVLNTHLRLHHGTKTLPKYQQKAANAGGLSPQGTMAAPVGGMMSPGQGAFGGMPPMAAGMTGLAPQQGGGAGNPVETVRKYLQGSMGTQFAINDLVGPTNLSLSECRSAIGTLVMEGVVTDQGGNQYVMFN